MHPGTPDMEWDPELENLAQAWADSLIVNNKFEHDPKNREQGTGENLYTYQYDGLNATSIGCERASKAWYVAKNILDTTSSI